MKKKIVGILVMMLLIAFPILSATETQDIYKFESKNKDVEPSSQPPIQWQNTYGLPFAGFGYFVQQTTDGGYIATGMLQVVTNHEVFLVKTDANGNTIWSQTYGIDTTYDCGYCVQQTTDGGYIIAGQYHGYALWLIKTDSSGNQQWNQLFTTPWLDTAYSVQQTTDGGYVMVGGYTYAPGPPDMWIIKTDSNGIKQWDTKTGGGSSEYGHCIRQTTDGGYIIAGYTDSFGAGQDDARLVKLDSGGNIVWIQNYGGTNDDRGNSVRQTSDGGYIMTGYTKSFGAGLADIYLVKTDSAGNLVWSQTYGGASDDEGNSVRQTTDGGYIIAGTTQSYGSGGVDAYLIKTDSTGNKQWDDTYGGTGFDDGQCVQQTSDGYYIIAGSTGNIFWLIKLGIPTNQPPNKPTTPSGPTRGTPGNSYPYQTSAIDPDGDKVEYGWDWTGNGAVDQWDNNGGSYYTSGVPITTSHSWPLQGTYNIKVVAKDINGAQGPWSNSLTVTMPRNRAVNPLIIQFLDKLFEQFPFLEWILNI